MRKAVTRAALTLTVALGVYATTATPAVGAVHQRPACGSHPCPLTTTKAPVAVKLGKLKSAGTFSTTKGTVRCYHIQAWESWNTNLGKNTFFDQVYWCGIPYVRDYANRTECNPFHQIVQFWNESNGNCTFGYGQNIRTIHTEATDDWTLHSPLNPLTLEELEPKLCVDVYANGYAKITCHN